MGDFVEEDETDEIVRGDIMSVSGFAFLHLALGLNGGLGNMAFDSARVGLGYWHLIEA